MSIKSGTKRPLVSMLRNILNDDGAIVLTQRTRDGASDAETVHGAASSVLIRVADVDPHHAQAARFGAQIIGPPADYPYGERQYTCEDVGGHRWTFSQSIADVAPNEWGGVAGML